VLFQELLHYISPGKRIGGSRALRLNPIGAGYCRLILKSSGIVGRLVPGIDETGLRPMDPQRIAPGFLPVPCRPRPPDGACDVAIMNSERRLAAGAHPMACFGKGAKRYFPVENFCLSSSNQFWTKFRDVHPVYRICRLPARSETGKRRGRPGARQETVAPASEAQPGLRHADNWLHGTPALPYFTFGSTGRILR